MTTTGDLSDNFFEAIGQTAEALQCNPKDLLSVMQNESGVRATAHNPHGHASGLIQFMPKTLRSLGWNSDADDTNNAANFRVQVTAEAQAAQWVQQYFKPYTGKLASGASVYQATFLPATLSLGSEPSTVISDPDKGPNSSAYAPNKVFDTDSKGFITVGDLQHAIDAATTGSRWQSIVDRLGGSASDAGLDLNTPDGVQAALVAIGYDPGPIDGKGGPRTRAALVQFQTDKADENGPLDGGSGTVGDGTTSALETALDNRSPSLPHTP
jgi:hypothetical protein